MRFVRRIRVVIPATLGALWMIGCAQQSPLITRATKFSSAATAATTDTGNAYQLVEQIYYEAQVAALVVSFDENGFHPETIQPFMAQKDMQVRTQVLNTLKSYAETLAEIAGGKPVASADEQAKASGTAAQTVSSSDLKPLASSGDSSDAAASAMNEIGKLLTERKTARELPAILEQMDKPIQTICSLLEEDIGEPDKSGLRNQLRISFTELIRKQQQFIRTNEASMTPAEKRAEIAQLPKMAVDESQADALLAKTQKELQDLAKTHAALAATSHEKNAPAFGAMLSEMVEEAQQLSSLYNSLQSKK